MKKRQAQPAAKVPDIFLLCAGKVRAMAETAREPDVRAGLEHLADLYQHCPTFYPNVRIRESDGLPIKVSLSLASGFGSPSAMCMEG